jgi:hypothetical protein
MGNSIAEEEFKDFKLKYETLKYGKMIKNGFGKLMIVEDPEKNLNVEKQIYYESKEAFLKIKNAMKHSLFSDLNYLEPYSANHINQKFFCTVSNIKVVFQFFELTLEDIIQKNIQILEEYHIWRIIFSITKILRYNDLHKIENNFIHTRSIFYDKVIDDFGLIHCDFFKENNFILAFTSQPHFCSPELFCQILSKKNQFFLQEQNKSNMFSLGLVLLKFLYKNEYQHDKIYDESLLQINNFYLHELTAKLAERGFSKLLIRVIDDMIQELEHIRISPSKFLKVLDVFESKLKNRDFKNYHECLSHYISVKSRQDDLSLEFKLEEIYSDPVRGEKNHFLQTNLEPNLFDTLNEKTVPFNYNFIDDHDFR